MFYWYFSSEFCYFYEWGLCYGWLLRKGLGFGLSFQAEVSLMSMENTIVFRALLQNEMGPLLSDNVGSTVQTISIFEPFPEDRSRMPLLDGCFFCFQYFGAGFWHISPQKQIWFQLSPEKRSSPGNCPLPSVSAVPFVPVSRFCTHWPVSWQFSVNFRFFFAKKGDSRRWKSCEHSLHGFWPQMWNNHLSRFCVNQGILSIYLQPM